MYVYTITNKINNKVYVGITNNYETRWRLHKQASVNKKHSEYNKVLYKAFRKYGITNFTFEVLAEVDSLEEAKCKEIEYITLFECLSTQNGYNVTKGGDYAAGQLKGNDSPLAKYTETQVQDIIERRDKGELRSEVFKEYGHIAEEGFNDIWLGNSWKHLQPEVIEKRHGRRYLTDENVRDIRESTKSGVVLAKEYCVPTSTISNIINFKTYKNIPKKV